jgi:hypothetical protein
MDSGLRGKVERVLHLVEGRRDAGFLQPLVDEEKQFMLLARQHFDPRESKPKQNQNNHYLFQLCSATV